MGVLEGNGFNGTRKCEPFKAKKASKMKPEDAKRRSIRHRMDDVMIAKEHGIALDELAN